MTPHRAPASHRQLVVATVAALVAVALAVLGTLDTWAGREVDAALGRALLAFALARGLNGVISVVQGTQVALEPGGLGVTLTPGEILDPVNDLVEQFSTVMLVASASLGLQKLLLGISAWWPLTLLMALALSGWIALAWRGGAVVVLGLRFHVLDVQDFTLGVEKGDRQRQEGVAHPHAVTVFLREDKEHAFIGLHGTPMHQALHAVLLVGGDFGVDAVEAGGQIHPRHGRLRVRGRGEQRGQAERRKKMAHL